MTEAKVAAGDRALETARKDFETWANAKGTMGKSWNGEYCENALHQAAWQAWQARAERAQEREPLDLLKRFVKRFEIKPSSDVCTVCKCRFEHSSDCLVAAAERLLAERGEGR